MLFLVLVVFFVYFFVYDWLFVTQVEVHRHVAVKTYKEYDSDMLNTWNDVEASYNEDFHLRSRERGECILKFKVR